MHTMFLPPMSYLPSFSPEKQFNQASIVRTDAHHDMVLPLYSHPSRELDELAYETG